MSLIQEINSFFSIQLAKDTSQIVVHTASYPSYSKELLRDFPQINIDIKLYHTMLQKGCPVIVTHVWAVPYRLHTSATSGGKLFVPKSH
jgi:hypothetical protein